MPIDIDRFEDATQEALRIDRSSNEDRVLDFLYYNRSEAYTLREIQSAVDRPLIDIAARLADLKDRGLVRHKGSFWTVEPDAFGDDDVDARLE